MAHLRLVASLILLVAGCAQTHRVRRYDPEVASEGEHVVYALPRVDADVRATVVTLERLGDAPCSADDLRPLGLEPVDWEGTRMAVSGFAVERRVSPDPQQVFLVDLSSTGTSTLALELTPEGYLGSADSGASDEIAGAVVGVLEAAAGIVGSVFFGAQLADGPEQSDERCQAITSNLTEARREMRQLDASIGAADSTEVLTVKRARMRVVVSTLEAAAVGVRYRVAGTVRCRVPIDQVGPVDVLRWSRDAGFGEAFDGVTCTLPRTVAISSPSNEPSSARRAVLRVSGLASVAGSATSFGAEAEGDRGFFYRIPGRARVELHECRGDECDAESAVRRELTTPATWLVPQLGVVASLPRLSATGSTRAAVRLDPQTGALLSANAESSGFDLASTAGTVGELGAGLAGSIQGSELADLQRQQAILEAQVAIEAAEEVLRGDPAGQSQ